MARNSGENMNTNTDVAELKVSLTLPEFAEPKKFKCSLTKTLQSWANKNKVKGEFTATEISEDCTTAVIRVTPAAALPELLALEGKALSTKDNKAFSITQIKPIENDGTITSQVNRKSSVKLSNERHRHVRESSLDSDKCLAALGPYWYLKSSYPDEMQRIEKENGVKITENVGVHFNAERDDANPRKASDDFTSLFQSCCDNSCGVSIPFKEVGPEEWKDTLKLLQATDHKCQIIISSDQITIYGPQQYQIAISKSLQQRPKISTNLTDEERVDHQEKMSTCSYTENRKTPTQESRSSIRNQLVFGGLSVEKCNWEIITNEHQKELENIMEKFSVCFKEAENTQDKIVIKACYNRSEESMQMETLAIRALQRLCQKVGKEETETSDDADSYSFDNSKEAAGKLDRSEEKTTKGGAVRKQSVSETKKDEKQEETCSLCLNVFIRKTKLDCKHEFCENCLERFESMCPICKYVFGLVEGDQPEGTMTWFKSISSLPGFERCGFIEITYNIPSGTQTVKHPKPGKHFEGLNVKAYLPDNKEGREVLQLLKRAFDQKLIFTIGTSRSTGGKYMVMWNGIRHKTSTFGGPQNFGYPDPDYLSSVKEELKAKGIK
ncbi:hypothetical protein WMY93_011708 [Mugilogobius chulae]|uniref:E3 ubiquitin-protein ligase n=1 Tax=Mugilogobius chulae TaxID=88201 RepID=A0AAW0P6U8_9GOBI